MNSGHEASFDRSKIIQGLCHRSEAVGGAGCCGDDLIISGQGLVVDVVNNGLQILACRSRDDDVLSTSSDVSHRLLLGGVETGALKNYIDIKLAPRKICCILLSVDGDFLAVNDDGVISRFNLSSVSAMSCIILKKICEHLRGGQIVDCNDFISLGIEHLSESKTSNTAKTINCYSYCHFSFLLKM